MTLTGHALLRRRYRAPEQDGRALVEPAPSQVGELLAANRALVASQSCDIQGESLKSLRRAARRELIKSAIAYSSRYCDTNFADVFDESSPLVLTGHQPQLFHPGVWFKNFAIDRIGKANSAAAINILIDNDLVRNASIRVPTATVDDPRVESVPFDASSDIVPAEERSVVDHDAFTSFASRVRSSIAPFVERPLVERLWRSVDSIIRDTTNLGECLAQARHRLESDLGLTTLDVPLSGVCESGPFHRFVAHLLANLPRFWEIYNSSLREYRRENKIRSHSHPAADLATRDRWLEAPLWIWSADDPRRRRVFARQVDNQIELSDLASWSKVLELSEDGNADFAIEQLGEFRRHGVKLRPRALITTMYARLVLSDLFVHGIGGAKYDELTDLIVARFFGLRSPAFLTLTATLLLPINRTSTRDDDIRSIDRQLREMVFHPENHLDSNCLESPGVSQLVAEKRRWIAENSTPEQLLHRHQEISRINQELALCTAKKRQNLAEKRVLLSRQLRNQRILGSREFSFCLFPEESLLPRLLELFNADL